MAGADTRSGFRVPWDGTLGPGLAGLSSGWLWSSRELLEKRQVVLVSLSIRGGHSRCLTPSKRQENMG